MRLLTALLVALARREALATLAHRSMIDDSAALRDRLARGKG